MRILYIFPHPDDESFGPAAAISRQLRLEREVFLLTLTRGGATKMRQKFGYSVDEMGEVRFREMQAVAESLELTGMTVLDLPDSGLKHLDPRLIEAVVISHIGRIRPNVVVTYPVHGISGFHDHIVTHAVVKRAFMQMKADGAGYLKRLAFFTLSPEQHPPESSPIKVSHSTFEEIDCIEAVEPGDVYQMRRALDCYLTYREVIEATGMNRLEMSGVCFELFGEEHSPPLEDLFAGLEI